MANGSTQTPVLKSLQTLYSVGAMGSLTDAQLLERFAAGRGGAVEAHFSLLMERHGPMVLRICRQVLGDSHDAEDAFQATFLVLIRRAGSVRKRDSLASWLYGVAHRVARRARVEAARRRMHERRGAARKAVTFGNANGSELGVELHDEIARLPEKYRAVTVLCYMQGQTTEAAARILGCPQGTVLSRLSRARERLRARLARHGVTVPVGVLVQGLAPNTIASAVPPALANATLRAALHLQYAAGAIPASVAMLTNTVLRTFVVSRIAKTCAALAALGIMAAGAAMFGRLEPGSQKPDEPHRAAVAGRSDRERIQGIWSVISAQDNGRPVQWKERGGKQTDGLKLLITSDTITFKVGDEIQGRGTYKLDPTKHPKWIDLTEKDGHPAPGIYTFQGDELTLCYNEAGTERPNRFASEASSPDPRSPRSPNDVLLILRREAPIVAGEPMQGEQEGQRLARSQADPSARPRPEPTRPLEVKALTGPKANPSRPVVAPRLDVILRDWQKRSREYTSLDLRFTEHGVSPVAEDEDLTGRVVLLRKGRALVEVVRLNGEGNANSTVRSLWADGAFHQLRLERKEHVICPIDPQDQGRLPAALALPFFWNLTAEGVKARYDLALVHEDAETWLLRIMPRPDAGASSFKKAYLQLDRATYLPRRYLLHSPEGEVLWSRDYRVTEARWNQPLPEEVFQLPELDGWKTIRPAEANATAWLFPLFKADLLP